MAGGSRFSPEFLVGIFRVRKAEYKTAVFLFRLFHFFRGVLARCEQLCDASRSRSRGEEVACVCVRAESRTCEDREALSRSLRIPHVVCQLRVVGDQAEQQT